MRSRKTVLLFVVFFLLPLILAPTAWASRKQQTIVIALDQSGSMVRSDPTKLRIEAAGLLAATLGAKDQVGIIGFGDSARWLQRPIERDRFNFHLLDTIGSSDAHTSFSPVLQAIDEYLAIQPSSFLEDNDVSLVLLTDGRSDPSDKLADADMSTALSIAGRNAHRLKIYTIGLGGNFDRSFLEQLARASNGSSISATSAADLPDAFLRVAARTAALPVYLRSPHPTSLEWTGTPKRVLVVFTGEHAATAQMPGSVLYRSANVAVSEQDPSHRSADIAWTGHGSAFLCVQEPLILSPVEEFPSALLTDAARPIALTLQNQQKSLKDVFFLQTASAHLELEGPDHEIVPLHQQDGTGIFTGSLEAQNAGIFDARAYLDSPYGEVEAFLGNVTASVVPVAIPQQVSASVFDPLPRSWFPTKLSVQPLLPVGAVNVRFSSAGALAGLPPDLLVAPGQKPHVKLVIGGALGVVHVAEYSATWSDGKTEISRHGALRVLTSQMTPVELFRAKWPWLAGVLLVIVGLVSAIWNFWPRPLQADLIVRQNGAQVLRLQLPAQLRTRMLHLSESETGQSSGADHAVIAGPQSRDLLSLQSARRRGRWTIVAHPRAARVQAQQCRKWSEIDLRAIHVPVFYTDDGTIQINVLYS
jgi:hypothetical protein